MVNCHKDDQADCCGKCGKKDFKVVACIPVFGRLPLLKHTIERLYKKNGVFKLICVGDGHEERKICESLGAEWVQHSNKPLGKKWNHAFMAAEKHNPDACLFVGSSDWLSDTWIDEMIPYMDDFDLVGTNGCYFMHIGNYETKVCFWPGYINNRKGESIGIGRMISARVLKKLQWKPFDDHLFNSLDGSMQKRVIKVAGNIHSTDSLKAKSVSISTDCWVNKHVFSDHWDGKLPSIMVDKDTFINGYFPEAKEVFK